MRLVQEKFTEEEDIIKNHVSATWAYPQKIYVLTKTGNIFQVDMVKDKTFAILSDIMLDKLMNEEIRPNTFIKSYYDGLVIVFPDSVVLIAITGNYIYIT